MVSVLINDPALNKHVFFPTSVHWFVFALAQFSDEAESIQNALLNSVRFWTIFL